VITESFDEVLADQQRLHWLVGYISIIRGLF